MTRVVPRRPHTRATIVDGGGPAANGPSPSVPERAPIDPLAHLGLVERIARHEARRLPAHVDLDDLIGAGRLGLLEAARRYDPQRDVSFPAFAAFRIKGAILDELRRGDVASRRDRRLARQVSRARDRLTESLGRPPRDQEIAATLGKTAEECSQWVPPSTPARVLSFDPARIPSSISESTPPPADFASPEASFVRRRQRDRAAAALRSLPPRQQLVLTLRYGDELKLAEIARRLDITESRACQLVRAATATLRACVEKNLCAALKFSEARPKRAA